MNFTEQLWSETERIYQKIIDHPFNTELAKGNLDIEKFRYYIYQDSLYLADYAKALALTAGKSTKGEMTNDFLRFASDSIIVENILHENYFKKFEINFNDGQSPQCFMYTNFLMNVCSNCSFEEAVAALLPCFWIYREAGIEIAKKTERNNRYIDWIDTYSGEEFNLAVERMLVITDILAEQASENLKKRMTEKYITGAKLEYLFWDGAYNLNRWII